MLIVSLAYLTVLFFTKASGFCLVHFFLIHKGIQLFLRAFRKQVLIQQMQVAKLNEMHILGYTLFKNIYFGVQHLQI